MIVSFSRRILVHGDGQLKTMIVETCFVANMTFLQGLSDEILVRSERVNIGHDCSLSHPC